MRAPKIYTQLHVDLNCEIREKFIAFVQGSYPQALPRTRLELDSRAQRPP